MVDRSQVLSRLIVENDRSGVAEVAPIVKTHLIMIITFLINLPFSFDQRLYTFYNVSEIDLVGFSKNNW